MRKNSTGKPLLCSPWDSNKNSHKEKDKIRGILYYSPAMQKAVTSTKRVNKGKSLLGTAGKLRLCPPCLPTCLYTAVMRLWMWKVGCRRMWMMAHLQQRSSWTERTGTCLMSTSTRKKRWAVVVGDSSWGKQRVQCAGQTLLVGKAAASLPPGLRTSLGKLLGGYSPRAILLYCSFMWVMTKLQQGQSKEMAWFAREFRSHLWAGIFENSKRKWCEIISGLLYPLGRAHGMVFTKHHYNPWHTWHFVVCYIIVWQ